MIRSALPKQQTYTLIECLNSLKYRKAHLLNGYEKVLINQQSGLAKFGFGEVWKNIERKRK